MADWYVHYMVIVMVLNATFMNISAYIVVVSFIGRGNQSTNSKLADLIDRPVFNVNKDLRYQVNWTVVNRFVERHVTI